MIVNIIRGLVQDCSNSIDMRIGVKSSALKLNVCGITNIPFELNSLYREIQGNEEI